ncbi:MAG: hypothetical protein U1A27_06325 [Phycisphaerae bacterium]
MAGATNHLPPGTKVKVITPGDPPPWSEWDDDFGRTSPPVKKRLQKRFFAGDPKISAEILYIGSESVRDELKRKGRIKVRIRELAGSTIVITAEANNICKK